MRQEHSVERICLLCQATFWYPRGANHPGKYCSHECRNAAMRTIPSSACLTCGRVVRKKKYCSQQCYWESLKGSPSPRDTRVVLQCITCGSDARVKAYRQSEFKYCSRECYLSVHTADNVTPELDLLRSSAAYRQWRTAVFERDNYTCVSCGDGNRKDRGETVVLQADHIKPFAHHPELRFDVNNGRTLCVPCHRKTDTYGGRSRAKVCVAVDATGY